QSRLGFGQQVQTLLELAWVLLSILEDVPHHCESICHCLVGTGERLELPQVGGRRGGVGVAHPQEAVRDRLRVGNDLLLDRIDLDGKDCSLGNQAPTGGRPARPFRLEPTPPLDEMQVDIRRDSQPRSVRWSGRLNVRLRLPQSEFGQWLEALVFLSCWKNLGLFTVGGGRSLLTDLCDKRFTLSRNRFWL